MHSWKHGNKFIWRQSDHVNMIFIFRYMTHIMCTCSWIWYHVYMIWYSWKPWHGMYHVSIDYIMCRSHCVMCPWWVSCKRNLVVQDHVTVKNSCLYVHEYDIMSTSNDVRDKRHDTYHVSILSYRIHMICFHVSIILIMST